jgi:hypothetical protein
MPNNPSVRIQHLLLPKCLSVTSDVSGALFESIRRIEYNLTHYICKLLKPLDIMFKALTIL